jgi:D-tagatose-1,6-bisphosphate aldolase subunit GatZ/KbaZ
MNTKMSKQHYLKEIVRSQKKEIPKGVCAICSASGCVIEASMEKALKENTYVLIEATSNQTNQFGGYTGMKPVDFKEFVFSIAQNLKFPINRVILGGDHLGPNPWKEEETDKAMEKASEMVSQYVLAGFSKIHIDTSMYLYDDFGDRRKPLDPQLIAERGVQLCLTAEKAFQQMEKSNPNAIPPVYVIGTEVPIPGGSSDLETELRITQVSDFKETMALSRETFYKHHLYEAWERVIAVVVYPGVGFGENTVYEYNREKAKDLVNTLKEFPNIVFEGHSTDYQNRSSLKQMVEDGIAILKVGPALTFAMREAFFMLSYIEEELFQDDPYFQLSHLIEVLDTVMRENPKHWEKYYCGHGKEAKLRRKYSFFDRSRYYWADPRIQDAIYILIRNLETKEIPVSLISQFFPLQYKKIRDGILINSPKSLIRDRIQTILEDYAFAVRT